MSRYLAVAGKKKKEESAAAIKSICGNGQPVKSMKPMVVENKILMKTACGTGKNDFA